MSKSRCYVNRCRDKNCATLMVPVTKDRVTMEVTPGDDDLVRSAKIRKDISHNSSCNSLFLSNSKLNSSVSFFENHTGVPADSLEINSSVVSGLLVSPSIF